MNKKIEKLQANIPADYGWSLKDVDERAEELGLSRTDFVLRAVDMLINYDQVFLDYVKDYVEGLKIPEYLVIQNMIIARMADEEAKREVYGFSSKTLDEFMSVVDAEVPRALTGKELKTYSKIAKPEITEMKREK